MDSLSSVKLLDPFDKLKWDFDCDSILKVVIRLNFINSGIVTCYRSDGLSKIKDFIITFFI
jgi:hypothetical protein